MLYEGINIRKNISQVYKKSYAKVIALQTKQKNRINTVFTQFFTKQVQEQTNTVSSK